VAGHYVPSIEGGDPTELYVILLGGEPAGFIQTYLVSDYPEYAALVGVGAGMAGVDLFLADPELLGRGIGSRVLREFVDGVVFAKPETTACVADPAADNMASLRAFEKAGFRAVRDFVDPEDGALHRLVRRERPGRNA
jgi:RimJ/RimL family protein N-acetyltransferase